MVKVVTPEANTVLQSFADACLEDPSLEDPGLDLVAHRLKAVTLVTAYEFGELDQYGWWFDEAGSARRWSPTGPAPRIAANNLRAVTCPPGAARWEVCRLRINVTSGAISCDFLLGAEAARWNASGEGARLAELVA